MYTVWLLSILLFILMPEYCVKIQAYRVLDVNGEETILALENEVIRIECKKDIPMAYCGFIHPTGKRYSFSGVDLIDGHCAIKIKATEIDTGEWRCHIGRKIIGMEIMQKKIVRVVKDLASTQTNITVKHNEDVTLSCVTTNGMTPLSYCRFEPPNGNPFNINSAVTQSNAILGRYYYPQNKSLDRGDCSVIIHKVKYTDVGIWTCGAGFDDGKEHIDTIKLEVEGLYTMSTASATNVTLAAIAIIVFLSFLGFVAWRKRRFLGTARCQPQEAEMCHEMQVMGEQSRTPRRSPQPSLRSQQLSQRSPQLSQRSPQLSQRSTEQQLRSIPRVVVESPSTPSSSPLIS